MKQILWLTLCLLALTSSAQLERTNWYFGNKAAISFETGKAVAKYDNPQRVLGASASISHPVTGKLLFYTSGLYVWNSKHNIMDGGSKLANGRLGDIVIVPVPGKWLQYYLFYVENGNVTSAFIDMNENSGDGKVYKKDILVPNQYSQISIVYHPYLKAFWIISHDVNSNTFNAVLQNADGSIVQSVSTSIGLAPELYGEMVANNKGNKLAVTHYQGNDFNVEVFDFDPICGKLSNAQVLPKEPTWDRAYGAAFSEDDSKLYITFSYQQSQLIQYAGNNFQSNYNIAWSAENFNILRLANDGKIYIATHDNGMPGPRIDAVLKPNELGGNCAYAQTYLTTENGEGRNAYFELPQFTSGTMFSGPIQDSIYKVTGGCLGEVTNFIFNTTNPFDSLRWHFGEGTNSSTSASPLYTYQTAGKFVVTLTLYRCGQVFDILDTVNIANPPFINFPPDSTICFGTSLILNGPVCDSYLWSTGQQLQSITVNKPDLVWLKATSGLCTNIDTINVKYYTPLWTELGEEYFICDDDNELVKLDAGKDFTEYKWTPTGDTTQWIIVGNLGDYFVVVKDYRGCDGNDGTKVNRRCPVNVFYPNVFTPNADGNNDIYLPIGSDVVSFVLTIYNAWGQQVFETNNILNGWDGTFQGKPAPDGTYIYQSTYSGYRNKRLVSFDVKGNVTLLR